MTSFLLMTLVLAGLNTFFPAAPLSQLRPAPTVAPHTPLVFAMPAPKAALVAAWRPTFPQF
ncbi:hypothetical protein MTX78_11985 [Hymenobacter tibetensis]|uniref:Uncharacterized protein n=1 Tax=Hymenobacter tibetensis TaxID=497967 RepID=A0ABY4CS13_9BACT|nr:hypothetical protein [Hymenobacter tibetensis]UOG72847.1 hypothetical protein MTX78_11985 [Hymenobacter tibetensis]